MTPLVPPVDPATTNITGGPGRNGNAVYEFVRFYISAFAQRGLISEAERQLLASEIEKPASVQVVVNRFNTTYGNLTVSQTELSNAAAQYLQEKINLLRTGGAGYYPQPGQPQLAPMPQYAAYAQPNYGQQRMLAPAALPCDFVGYQANDPILLNHPYVRIQGNVVLVNGQQAYVIDGGVLYYPPLFRGQPQYIDSLRNLVIRANQQWQADSQRAQAQMANGYMYAQPQQQPLNGWGGMMPVQSIQQYQPQYPAYQNPYAQPGMYGQPMLPPTGSVNSTDPNFSSVYGPKARTRSNVASNTMNPYPNDMGAMPIPKASDMAQAWGKSPSATIFGQQQQPTQQTKQSPFLSGKQPPARPITGTPISEIAAQQQQQQTKPHLLNDWQERCAADKAVKTVTNAVKEEGIPIDPKTMRVSDATISAIKYPIERSPNLDPEMVTNAELPKAPKNVLRTIKRPNWTDMLDVKEDRKEEASYWHDYDINWKVEDAFGNEEEKHIHSAVVRLPLPYATKQAAIYDAAITCKSSLGKDKEDDLRAHILDFDQMVQIPNVDFERAKAFCDRVALKLEEAERKNRLPQACLEVALELRDGKESFHKAFSDIIVAEFNRAARANFIRKIDRDHADVFGFVNDIYELYDFVDPYSGNPLFECWKQDKEHFKIAMNNTLQASFRAVWWNARNCYLDHHDVGQRIFIMCDEGLGYRDSDGMNSRLLTAVPEKDERYQKFLGWLDKHFTLLIRRRVVIANTFPIEDIENTDYTTQYFRGNTTALVYYEFFSSEGNLELVDLDSLDTINHPLILGVSYNNELVARRSAE